MSHLEYSIRKLGKLRGSENQTIRSKSEGITFAQVSPGKPEDSETQLDFRISESEGDPAPELVRGCHDETKQQVHTRTL